MASLSMTRWSTERYCPLGRDRFAHRAQVPECRPLVERLPERIEADGLLLRRWIVDDAEPLQRLVAENDEHLRPWMPWMAKEPMSFADRVALLGRWGDEWKDGGDVLLGVFRKGELAGSCGLHRRIGPGGLELGYWIAKNRLRQGLATAVARALTEAALAVPGVEQVEIHHDRDNKASASIPAKLGYEFVAERSSTAKAPAESGVEWVWRR
jgi:ribosomal-protein-serine acetyltransferase